MKIIDRDKIKDVLITRTAIKCLTATEVVEKIVNFQGKDASEAVKIHKEVEFVGWGKFMISQAKVRRRVFSMERGIIIVTQQIEDCVDEARIRDLNIKLEAMKEKLLYYKSKLNE